MDFVEVRKLVLLVVDEKVTEQLVEQLIKYLPNKEEMMQLTAFKDKLNDLSDAERFGVIVSYSSYVSCCQHVVHVIYIVCMLCVHRDVYCKVSSGPRIVFNKRN